MQGQMVSATKLIISINETPASPDAHICVRIPGLFPPALWLAACTWYPALTTISGLWLRTVNAASETSKGHPNPDPQRRNSSRRLGKQ